MVIKGILVVAGHSKHYPGAKAYNGMMEHYYTTKVQKDIVIELKNYAVEVFTDYEGMSLPSVIAWVNKVIRTGYIVIDIHFNNNNPSASGTEIFIHKKSNRWVREVATRISNNLSAAQGIPLRRYKSNRDYKYPEESFRGQLGIIENTIFKSSLAPVFLPEICFLNEKDMNNFDSKLVAKTIVNSLDLRVKLTCQDPKTEKRV